MDDTELWYGLCTPCLLVMIRYGEHGTWVLIADADEASRRLLGLYLRERGLSTIETSSGFDAMSAARTTPLVLAVVDMKLEDMAGQALVGTLRSIYPALPVVMTTTEEQRCMEIHARKVGIVHYATKPVTFDTIAEIALRAARRTNVGPDARGE